MDQINDILVKLAFAGVCAIIAILLKMHKDRIIVIATQLIQEAEQAIQGSGLGAEKKSKVIAQLNAMGVTVNSWLDAEIDDIVSFLNDKSGWLISDVITVNQSTTTNQNSAK